MEPAVRMIESVRSHRGPDPRYLQYDSPEAVPGQSEQKIPLSHGKLFLTYLCQILSHSPGERSNQCVNRQEATVLC